MTPGTSKGSDPTETKRGSYTIEPLYSDNYHDWTIQEHYEEVITAYNGAQEIARINMEQILEKLQEMKNEVERAKHDVRVARANYEDTRETMLMYREVWNKLAAALPDWLYMYALHGDKAVLSNPLQKLLVKLIVRKPNEQAND